MRTLTGRRPGWLPERPAESRQRTLTTASGIVPSAQRCGVMRQMVRLPMPPSRLEGSRAQSSTTPPTCLCPLLEPFVSPPTLKGPERLKGIGLLAQAERIN